MRDKVSAIYVIRNKVNGKIYIGSSFDVYRRISTHKCLLKKNSHHAYKLQRAWNKYREENFEFIVLERVYLTNQYSIEYRYEMLECIEQYYMDKYQSYSKNNYNTSNTSGVPRSADPSKATRKAWITRRNSGKGFFTEEHKKNISISLKQSTALKEALLANGKKRRKIVYQYSVQGDFVKEWRGGILEIRDSNPTLFRYHGIMKSIRKEIKSYKGYIFSYQKITNG